MPTGHVIIPVFASWKKQEMPDYHLNLELEKGENISDIERFNAQMSEKVSSIFQNSLFNSLEITSFGAP